MSQTIYFNSRTPEWAWLSNFSPHPIRDSLDVLWPTVEHYYQAMKTNNPTEQQLILQAETPAAAKKLGKTLSLRKDWNGIRITVMSAALKAKFLQHPKLRQKLLDTNPAELIHEAPWDSFWGNGKDGHGTNQLGLILMGLRRLYLEEEAKNPQTD